MANSKLIVIGDVHGCAEELNTLVRKLPLDQDTSLLFLGDYVDRGPDSKGVIDTVLDLSELYSVIALRGNHEAMFQQFLADPNNSALAGNFILNGGSATLASYSVRGASYDIPAPHRAFLRDLKLFYATETHFFVHAGIPPDFNFAAESGDEVDAKTAHQFLWIRNHFLKSQVRWPRLVVHGHTPVDQIELLPNRINLDTGCVYGRRLTAMHMGTGKVYSVERNQGDRPTFLTHTLRGGRERAQRFDGEVDVSLFLGNDQKPYPFRTVNFNEFGLLVFAAGESVPPLSLGQAVTGLIQFGDDHSFRFQGAVVRVDPQQGVLRFGIKFDELKNLQEPL